MLKFRQRKFSKYSGRGKKSGSYCPHDGDVFSHCFWKYVNPICGSIGQLIQDGLLTNEFLEPFSRKNFFQIMI